MAVKLGSVVFERVRGGSYREWTVEDFIYTQDGVSALLECDARRATVDEMALREAVNDPENSNWVRGMVDNVRNYDDPATEDIVEWVPHPRQASADADDGRDVELRIAPTSPSHLTFEQVHGDGSRKIVSKFLEGGDDGLVDHELGRAHTWKIAFVGRYRGKIISALVLHHYHPSTNGVEIAITRLANHTSAPANTSSWMIARARKWAERAGFERIATYAGVGDNEGVCYEAAGFDAVGEATQTAGKDWSGGRDDEAWTRQKFIDHLSPSTYADKDSEWAIESVVDARWTPARNDGAWPAAATQTA